MRSIDAEQLQQELTTRFHKFVCHENTNKYGHLLTYFDMMYWVFWPQPNNVHYTPSVYILCINRKCMQCTRNAETKKHSTFHCSTAFLDKNQWCFCSLWWWNHPWHPCIFLTLHGREYDLSQKAPDMFCLW